jgi:hypothetical protein
LKPTECLEILNFGLTIDQPCPNYPIASGGFIEPAGGWMDEPWMDLVHLMLLFCDEIWYAD